MTQSDKIFAGSIPEIYDTYLVPLIFEAFAEDLAERTAALSPSTVLETAAGSGVVTRALAPKLGNKSRLVVTDLNSPMLDRAKSRQPEDKRLEWRQADALNLPFDDASFDAVCCQFGIMFFPDRVAGYREALRVLKPNGCFLFNVWDRIEMNEFAQAVTEAAGAVFEDDPPLFLARTPHGHHDMDVVNEELQTAGFSNIAIETVEETSRAPSPRHPAVAYCKGTPLRNEIDSRNGDLLDYVTERAAAAIAERFGSGPVSGMIRGHVIRAMR